MNAGNNPNKAINTTTISKPEPILTAPLIEATPPTPTPASQFEINRHTGQTAPA